MVDGQSGQTNGSTTGDFMRYYLILNLTVLSYPSNGDRDSSIRLRSSRGPACVFCSKPLAVPLTSSTYILVTSRIFQDVSLIFNHQFFSIRSSHFGGTVPLCWQTLPSLPSYHHRSRRPGPRRRAVEGIDPQWCFMLGGITYLRKEGK